jgi:DnaD/phage-associated family protein
MYVQLKQYAFKTNKCFTAINTLAKNLGLSENTVRKILRNLKSKGYIDIVQRFNSSNEYTILTYPEYSSEIKNLTVNAKEPEGIAKVFLTYENNINPTYGSMEREKLIKWFETFENNADILIKAIEVATAQGVRNLRYLDKVLMSWQENGVKNMEQCQAFLKNWERNRGGNSYGNTGKNTEGASKPKYDFSKYGEI